jgi:hypothetical protein
VKCDEIQPRCGVCVTINLLGVDVLMICFSLVQDSTGSVIGRFDGMYVDD